MKKSLLMILLAAVLCLNMTVWTVPAAAETALVSYVERSWNGAVVVKSSKTATATQIKASNSDLVDLYTGWYYVSGTVETGSGTTLRIKGDTKLILRDGCKLTVKEAPISKRTAS